MRHSDILTRDGSVLLICDVQKKCIKPIYKKEAMINNIKSLVSFAGLTGLPVLLTELSPQRFGTTIDEVKGLVPRLEAIKRTKYSCFGNEELTLRLESMNTQRLIVLGMETHISICPTVLDAITRGYSVHVVLNATSSARKVNWKVAIEKMRRAGAVITTADIVMHELMGGTDHPKYEQCLELTKKISDL
ncbi:MAG: isochorismatase family protein [Candidatus Riflebacteria bacterium]|nr:isochorismatase family protein [Candidatus Riflebacteria bacterium]